MKTTQIKTGDTLEKRKAAGHALKLYRNKTSEIFLDKIGITKFLGLTVAILLSASLCSVFLNDIDLVYRFGNFFYVDEEKNIPTFFSVLLIQIAAVLLLIIAFDKGKKSPLSTFYWTVLALGFSLMAVDEGWRIHEWLSNYFQKGHGFLRFSWIIPFFYIIPFFLLFFIKFLWDLPSKTSKLFILAAALYIGGAIGAESLSAYFYDYYGLTNIWYVLSVTVEEGLEMAGLIVFIYTLLDYVESNIYELKISFNEASHKNHGLFLNPSVVLNALGITMFLLLTASLCSKYFTGIDLIRRFGHYLYVDEEMNVPTFYSTFLIEFAAVLLTVISFLKVKASSSSSVYWIILTLGFSFMAIDEAWSIHEWIDEPGGLIKPGHGLLRFAWYLPFFFILPVIFLFFRSFMKRLPKKTRRLFNISAVFYLTGAICFEAVGGLIVDTLGRQNWLYYLEVTLEEGFEMTGMILFIYALLSYLNENYKEVWLILSKNRKPLSKIFSKN